MLRFMWSMYFGRPVLIFAAKAKDPATSVPYPHSVTAK
jgi:hypothetical protein